MQAKVLERKILNFFKCLQWLQTKEKKLRNYRKEGVHCGFQLLVGMIQQNRFLRMIESVTDISSQEKEEKVGTDLTLTGYRH